MTTAATSTATCCTPTPVAALGDAQTAALAEVFKALGEPARLRLISMVAAHTDGEACICDLTEPVGLSQSTVSHHMKVLVDAGLLTRQQRGKWAHYRLVPGAVDTLTDALIRMARTQSAAP